MNQSQDGSMENCQNLPHLGQAQNRPSLSLEKKVNVYEQLAWCAKIATSPLGIFIYSLLPYRNLLARVASPTTCVVHNKSTWSCCCNSWYHTLRVLTDDLTSDFLCLCLCMCLHVCLFISSPLISFPEPICTEYSIY